MEDDFDSGGPRGADDRPRGVSKAKLKDIDLAPKLAIFYRPHRNAPMVPLEISFPKEAVKIFCDRVRGDLEETSARSYVITGGEQAAYKMILVWVNNCILSQSIEKFPDIPEPENDPFTPTINVINASEHLGIPAGSLSYHLKKRLNGCARKNLMPFHQVRDLYNMNSDAYNVELKDIACASVFNAWWDARLDESVNPELMEELSDMREDIKELDNDLHQACVMREEQVRKKWAEKRLNKITEQTADVDGWDNADNNAAVVDESWKTMAASGTGDWDAPGNEIAQNTTRASGDWAKENTKPTGDDAFNDWTEPQTITDSECAIIDDDSPTKDWADEMNDTLPEASRIAAQIQW